MKNSIKTFSQLMKSMEPQQTDPVPSKEEKPKIQLPTRSSKTAMVTPHTPTPEEKFPTNSIDREDRKCPRCQEPLAAGVRICNVCSYRVF